MTAPTQIPDVAGVLSLRDHFALAALAGVLAAEDYGSGQNYYVGEAGAQVAAERAYELADAMLIARTQA